MTRVTESVMLGEMTTLAAHLAQNGSLGPKSADCLALAQRAACSPETLYLIALGHKRAGPNLARRIEAATEGRVPKETLRPDLWGDGESPTDTRAA